MEFQKGKEDWEATKTAGPSEAVTEEPEMAEGIPKQVNHNVQKKDLEFDAELDALMQEDTSDKKWKKKKRPRWSRKKKLIIAGVAAILVFAGYQMTAGKKPPVMVVPTAPLIKGDIVENLVVSGPVSGTDSVDVVSNLHAEVLDIMVKEGDKVAEDQLLAIVDSADAQKEVDIAQNSYDLAVATYQEQERDAANGYAKAVQDYQAARTNYERTSALFQSGGASLLELETSGNAMNDAQRQIGTFTLKNGKAVANESYSLAIKTAGYTLEQKKKDLENTQITSPIAGTVVRVNSKIGRFADKTDVDEKPMFVIDNLDNLEMKINVSEYYISKVELGQKVNIRADILGDEIVNGEITAISPTGEEKGNGSTERVIPTTVRIIDKNTKLIAGITAKAEILLNEAKDAFVVPISAVLQKEDGSYIAVLKDGKISLIGVDLGVESDIQAEIIAKEGFTLEENMEVVLTPNAGFTDGMAAAAMTPQV